MEYAEHTPLHLVHYLEGTVSQWTFKPLQNTHSVVKNVPANAEDAWDSGSAPGLVRSPGGENGNPLQYFCLKNSMDRGA